MNFQGSNLCIVCVYNFNPKDQLILCEARESLIVRKHAVLQTIPVLDGLQSPVTSPRRSNAHLSVHTNTDTHN